MIFRRYGSGWSLALGWLSLDWSTFEDHWHLSLTWAKPLPPTGTKPDCQ